METSVAIDGLAGHKVKELRARGFEISGCSIEIDTQILHDGEVIQGWDRIRQTGRDGLNWKGSVEVFKSQPRCVHKGFAVVLDAKRGIHLRHFAKCGLTGRVFKAHRHFADVQFESYFALAALPAQCEGGAESRMPRQRQFLLNRE